MTSTIDTGVPSFDPRTWGGDAPPAQPVTSPPLAPPPQPTRVPRNSSQAAPIGALVVLLLAGAGASWLARPAADLRPAPVVAPAAPAAPVVEASRRTLLIAGPEKLADALASAGVAPEQAGPAARAAAGGIGEAPGQVRLVLDLVGGAAPYRLTRLEATRDDGSGAVATPDRNGAGADRFVAERLAARLDTRVKVVRGEMDATSFYTSAVAAGITDSLVGDFADALAFDFDFQREIRPGDVFEAAFEQEVNAQGREVGRPRLLYVAMTTPTKSRSLYRFLAPGETEAGWYDGNGRSTVRALLRTPVDGARVSSQFGMRIHPVLGYAKLHRGTDFAAPIGTAIYAAGDGVVEWAAMKGPNGNLTILRHDNGWETYYLHQSRFLPGIVAGARVHQGQEIGEIGTTGRSTGPHLHYEVHIDRQPVNPMTVDADPGGARPLAGGALAAFIKERDRTDTARARALD